MTRMVNRQGHEEGTRPSGRRSRPDDTGAPARPAIQGERIQKVLSRAGLASRREAERWLAQGRITVNGAIVTEPGTRIDAARDHLRVDGRPIRDARRHVYFLLNKPDNCVTTTSDPEGRLIVLDLLRGVRERVFPVGRLDYHTTGLLILTNDGDLADRLLRPASGCEKLYRAKVRGTPEPPTIRRLAHGIVVGGRRTLPCRIKLVGGEGNAWMEVRLKEGRRNQIRKMFEAVGHPVSKLHRVAIGPLTDKGLPPGRYRELTVAEVRRLRESLT